MDNVLIFSDRIAFRQWLRRYGSVREGVWILFNKKGGPQTLTVAQAYTNLLAMSKSVQRNYTGYYLDTKSDKTRQARLEKIIDRLNKGLKPM